RASCSGSFWRAEPSAIVEPRGDAFAPPEWPGLPPADVRARARARQIMLFLGGDLFALARERPSWSVLYPRQMPPLSPAARADANELLGIALRLVGDGALEPWSIACADLTFALLRLVRSGEGLAPALQAVVGANLARPSLADYLHHDRPPNPPTTGRRAFA